MAKVKFKSDTSLAGYAGIHKPTYTAGEEADLPDELVAKIAPFVEQLEAPARRRKQSAATESNLQPPKETDGEGGQGSETGEADK